MHKNYIYTEEEYNLIDSDFTALLEECEKGEKADITFIFMVAKKIYNELR